MSATTRTLLVMRKVGSLVCGSIYLPRRCEVCQETCQDLGCNPCPRGCSVALCSKHTSIHTESVSVTCPYLVSDGCIRRFHLGCPDDLDTAYHCIKILPVYCIDGGADVVYWTRQPLYLDTLLRFLRVYHSHRTLDCLELDESARAMEQEPLPLSLTLRTVDPLEEDSVDWHRHGAPCSAMTDYSSSAYEDENSDAALFKWSTRCYQDDLLQADRAQEEENYLIEASIRHNDELHYLALHEDAEVAAQQDELQRDVATCTSHQATLSSDPVISDRPPCWCGIDMPSSDDDCDDDLSSKRRRLVPAPLMIVSEAPCPRHHVEPLSTIGLSCSAPASTCHLEDAPSAAAACKVTVKVHQPFFPTLPPSFSFTCPREWNSFDVYLLVSRVAMMPWEHIRLLQCRRLWPLDACLDVAEIKLFLMKELVGGGVDEMLLDPKIGVRRRSTEEATSAASSAGPEQLIISPDATFRTNIRAAAGSSRSRKNFANLAMQVLASDQRLANYSHKRTLSDATIEDNVDDEV